ncbi:hypothetical protein MHU86_16909 [Fragilaria crotonensis]|nr:hypothetical protein MHU86_16909 [Fragilaria crotonensis]
MYAIVHPAAVVCKGPNHEPYDRVKVLQDLGYKVTILGSPVIKANMKGYVKNNIDSDAGDRDFMRIQGFTYDHHPAVVLVDFTTLVLKPLDNIFDNFLKDTKKKIIFTYDYPDKLPNTGKNSGMSSHFVIAKPSAQFFQTLTDAYKNINFSPTMGWNWQGIKDFKGALGTKGFFVHYFTRVEAGVNDVLSRCVFGSDASNPRAMDPSGNVVCRDPLDCRDCRSFDFKSMKVIKMIHTCGKPWECHYDDAWDAATKTACEGFHRAWFSARVDFEQSCWSNGPPSFRNGAFKPDVFMGFCACSGITCYDRMIDDKSAPSVCDKDTQTSVGVGRITFPNGAYQDQKLSLTTGQVTGSSTACMSGKISLDGYDPPYNLGIVIDVSGSTGGPFAGSVVGDVNSDGEYNTILDAEIAAIIAVLEDIAASPGLGNDNVSIGLTTFSTNAEYLGIFTPCEPSDPSKVNAALLTKLKALRSSGFTHFDDALDKTITFYEQAPKNRNNLLMFLSDGVPNVVGDGDKEEPTNTYEDNQPGTMEYASELAILDSFKVKRIAVGVGAKSDVGEGFGLDMIDNTLDPYTNKGPTLATTTDALKGALLNSPLGGVLLDFKVSVNGAVQSNIDESHVKSGPTGFTYGRFVVSGLDPHNGAINEISVTATVDYDGLLATTNDQVILTTFNIIPGTLL